MSFEVLCSSSYPSTIESDITTRHFPAILWMIYNEPAISIATTAAAAVQQYETIGHRAFEMTEITNN